MCDSVDLAVLEADVAPPDLGLGVLQLLVVANQVENATALAGSAGSAGRAGSALHLGPGVTSHGFRPGFLGAP